MANQRQRLARKRFASQIENQTSQTRKRIYSKLDERNEDSSAEKGTQEIRSKGKNPAYSRKEAKIKKLRKFVGKRGEGCFICKSAVHIAKLCPRKFSKDQKKVCLLCRQMGHTLSSCPSKQTREDKVCYNCGEVGHRLAQCKILLKDGRTTYAECFLCKEKGHLSRSCPSNTHGIYPKGGSCKICGDATHLAKDCPEKSTAMKANDICHAALQTSKELTPSTKHIVFRSGDDLEDDFGNMRDDDTKQRTENPKKKFRAGGILQGKTGKGSSKLVNFNR